MTLFCIALEYNLHLWFDVCAVLFWQLLVVWSGMKVYLALLYSIAHCLFISIQCIIVFVIIEMYELVFQREIIRYYIPVLICIGLSLYNTIILKVFIYFKGII